MLLCFRHWSRYGKYIKKSVRRDLATIVRLVTSWAPEYALRARDEFQAVLDHELKLVEFLVQLQDHNIQVRPKPGSTHSLCTYRSSRGVKVEVVHGPSKHFANLGMRYKLFQALQMEGASGMNADRREEAKRLVGSDGDDCARAATAVVHYRPWVRRERNRLAQGSEFLLPHPGDGFERCPDNGERFYVEYAIEQAARRADNGGVYFTSR